MASPFLSVQFIVLGLLAATGLLTLGRWLHTSEFRTWSWAWLSWAAGAACLSVAPAVSSEFWIWLLAGHVIGYAAFALLMAQGCMLAIHAPDVPRRTIRLIHGVLIAAIVLVTVLLAWERWPAIHPGVDLWWERHYWSSLWLVSFAVFSIWIVTRHEMRWNLRPPIILFVVALVLFGLAEAVFFGVLASSDEPLSRTDWSILSFIISLEPILAGLVGLAMHTLVMDGLVDHLEKTLVQVSKRSAKLKVMAERDPLTAVLNRHAFYSLVAGKRQDKDKPLGGSVAVLDIDNLKPLNDQHGHQAGDAAIRSVAKAIRSVIRAEDLLFRWGGDEFLAILPHVHVEEARWRFQKLENLLQKMMLPGVPSPVTITLSVGVSSFSTATSLEKAIEEADERMYARKTEKKQGLPPIGQRDSENWDLTPGTDGPPPNAGRSADIPEASRE
jgi:diguanylate cyclase (GGDEF)-like protein